MIKKIKTEQLKPGMFVHDFNCGWLNHPFLRNRVLLKSDAEIEKIIEHQIKDVYIDTDHGLDADDAPTKQCVSEVIQEELNKLKPTNTARRSIPVTEEIENAKNLLCESKRETQILMDTVRLGMKLDLPQVEVVVDRMTESV